LVEFVKSNSTSSKIASWQEALQTSPVLLTLWCV